MISTLMMKGSRRALSQIRYVSPIPPAKATGLVRKVYVQTERDFGMLAPPVALHSSAPGPLAAVWVMLRETLVAPGNASRAEKEAVAAAVSDVNSCPYCVTIHSAAARGLPAEPGLHEVARWARSTGRPGTGQLAPTANFAELAGVAVTFHYLNRMVSVFLPDSPLPARLPKPAGGWFMRVLGSVMVSGTPVPGTALDLLPEAPLPDEFVWAAGESRVATALASAAAALEDAGAAILPPRVREFVCDRLRGWDGHPPGPSRAWADTEVAGLAVSERPAGRLAILTAQAPYQIGPDVIEDFRSSGRGRRAGDDELVGLTAWASMAAARTAGSWLRTSRT
jgi:AhpD family alkylhydroperoxidase